VRRSTIIPLLLALLLLFLDWQLLHAQQPAVVDWTHPITRGLVAWWRGMPGFTGGMQIVDFTGRGTLGTFLNMSSASAFGGTSGWAPTGRQGGYMHMALDGVDDAVTFGTPAVLTDLPQKTICAWIYLRSFGGGSLARIIDKQANNGWFVQVNNSEITNGFSYLHDFTSFAKWGVANSLSLNVWTHIAVLVDSTAVVAPNFFVNGVLQTSVTTITTGSGT